MNNGRVCIAVILSTAFGLSLSLSCLAQAQSELAQGISLYEKKDYARAQTFFLRAVHGEFKNVAVAHYYLANTLMQTSKVNAALDEYERCYQLAPYSSFSGYCRMMLLRHGRNPDGNVSASGKNTQTAEPAKAAVPPATDGTKETTDSATSAPNHALEAEIKALSNRLPRLIAIQKESPQAAEILAGNIFQRAAFLSEAENRKGRATEKLEQARNALSKAETLTLTIVPSQKKFGEGDEEFKTRRADVEKAVAEVLTPYRESVKEAETAFQTEAGLFESCLNASRGYL